MIQARKMQLDWGPIMDFVDIRLIMGKCFASVTNGMLFVGVGVVVGRVDVEAERERASLTKYFNLIYVFCYTLFLEFEGEEKPLQLNRVY